MRRSSGRRPTRATRACWGSCRRSGRGRRGWRPAPPRRLPSCPWPTPSTKMCWPSSRRSGRPAPHLRCGRGREWGWAGVGYWWWWWVAGGWACRCGPQGDRGECRLAVLAGEPVPKSMPLPGLCAKSSSSNPSNEPRRPRPTRPRPSWRRPTRGGRLRYSRWRHSAQVAALPTPPPPPTPALARSRRRGHRRRRARR